MAEEMIVVVMKRTRDAEALREAWHQLGIHNGLRIIPEPDDGLRLLGAADNGSGNSSVQAIILDAEVTAEATGSFLREVRRIFNGHPPPVVLWSKQAEAYEVLEGRGIASSVTKPMLLPLIQELHAASRLHLKPSRRI